MYLKLTMNIIINFLVLLYPSWWKRYIWHFIHGLWGREDNILYINKIFLNIFEHVTSPVSIYIVGYEEFLTNVISTVSSDFFFFFFFFFVDWSTSIPLDLSLTKSVDGVPIRQRSNSVTDSNSSSNSNEVIIDEWKELDIEAISFSLFVMK